MIVMKFGGSSVASAASIEWAANIVKRHLERRPVVVVSAMGKTTDRLHEIFRYATRGSTYSAWRGLEDLRQFHVQETKRLLRDQARGFIEERIEPLFRDLHGVVIELQEGGKPSPAIQDNVLSFGERLSSEIVAATLAKSGVSTTHVHAPDVIVTGEEFTCAKPLLWETCAKLRRTVAIAARESVVVMGGFIGATADGRITTFGRGGSDLTASLVGAGISAEEIQIWTDVDGMLSCEPRVLRGGYLLRSLSYDEAEEMACLGAKVLYESAVAPAVRQGIPIVVRNSRHPEIEGTVIGPRAARQPGTVKSIACRKGVTVVHLTVRGAVGLTGIAEALHELFQRNGIAVRLVQSRPDGVSFAVTTSECLPELLRGIEARVQVSVEERMAVVSLVGDSISGNCSIAERAQAAVGSAVCMMAHAPSGRSMRLVIPEAALLAVVEQLHREFFRSPDPEIFAATPESEWHVDAAPAPATSAALGLALADARI